MLALVRSLPMCRGWISPHLLSSITLMTMIRVIAAWVGEFMGYGTDRSDNKNGQGLVKERQQSHADEGQLTRLSCVLRAYQAGPKPVRSWRQTIRTCNDASCDKSSTCSDCRKKLHFDSHKRHPQSFIAGLLDGVWASSGSVQH